MPLVVIAWRKKGRKKTDCLIYGNLSDPQGVAKVQEGGTSGAEDIPGGVE